MIVDTKDYTVEYHISDQATNDIVTELIKYFIRNEVFDAEMLLQMDDPIIEAAPLLGKIADNFIKFKVTWK